MSETKKKTKPPKYCGCLEKLDETLKPMNAKVVRRITFDFAVGTVGMSGAQIAVEKRESKGRSKLPTIMCSFCPVCGKKCI